MDASAVEVLSADTEGLVSSAALDASPAGREGTALWLIDRAAEGLIVAALLGELVLVLNIGSSSIKYQLLDADTGDRPARGLVERIGEPKGRIVHTTPSAIPWRIRFRCISIRSRPAQR